jgi:hypothetical protein
VATRRGGPERLLRGAGRRRRLERRDATEVHDVDGSRRGARRPDLLAGGGDIAEAAALAAVLLGDREAEEPCVSEGPELAARVATEPVGVLGERGDGSGGDLPGLLEQIRP